MKIVLEEYEDNYTIDYKNGYYRLISPEGRVIKDDFLSYEDADNYIESSLGLPVEYNDEDDEYVVYRHYQGRDGYPYRSFSLSDKDPSQVCIIPDKSFHEYIPNKVRAKIYNDLNDALSIADKFNKGLRSTKYKWRVDKKWW